MRARAAIAGLFAASILAAPGVAVALAGVTQHNSITRSLPPGATKRFVVAYPDAHKFGGSRYAGKVLILPPAPHALGKKPALSKVQILGQGPCNGGSDFCARVRNANRVGTAPVRVRVITATELPPAVTS